MPGIYIHIPFCKQKCSYCNFYFSVSTKTRDALVDAILKEIDLNNSYLKSRTINSIYFGGGTPSVLDVVEIGSIIDRIKKYYNFDKNIEITLEANPDDIDKEYLTEIKKIGINRFSMGVQSFVDEELSILNRYHNACKAEKSIKEIQDAGFENMNIDLIFGIPGSTLKTWDFNLNKFLELNITHLSAYNLTIEPKTVLAHQIKKGIIAEPDDDLGAKMFLQTSDKLSMNSYEHYEISNYAKDKVYALHNTNYWKGEPYLGIGPSAHSFNGISRQWNIANNRKYIESINKNILPIEKEILTDDDKYNEYIMTGLRTMWGIDIDKINIFGVDKSTFFLKEINEYLNKGYIIKRGTTYTLSRQGKLYADRVASNLFV